MTTDFNEELECIEAMKNHASEEEILDAVMTTMEACARGKLEKLIYLYEEIFRNPKTGEMRLPGRSSERMMGVWFDTYRRILNMAEPEKYPLVDEDMYSEEVWNKYLAIMKERRSVPMKDVHIRKIFEYVKQWDDMWDVINEGKYVLMSVDELRDFNDNLRILGSKTMHELDAMRMAV